MQFVCDVHISFKVVRFLEQEGFSVVHVNKILNGDKTTDQEIADHCNNSDAILITKDEDFIDSYLLKKQPRKLIKINLGNISTQLLIERLKLILLLAVEKNKSDFFLIEVGSDFISVSE